MDQCSCEHGWARETFLGQLLGDIWKAELPEIGGKIGSREDQREVAGIATSNVDEQRARAARFSYFMNQTGELDRLMNATKTR